MKKSVILTILLAFVLSMISPYIAYAGWKENYRTKYSKRQLDPDSEKAKRIRRLLNPDLKIVWKKKKKEGAATEKRTLTERLTHKKKEVSKDTFEGYTTNFSPAKAAAQEQEEDIK